MQPRAGTDLVCIWNVLPSKQLRSSSVLFSLFVIYDPRKKQSGPLVCMISRCLIRYVLRVEKEPRRKRQACYRKKQTKSGEEFEITQPEPINRVM